ncbi:MAG: hypothetical protein WAT64_09420, partial [Dokdonella sp.]
MVLLLLSGDGEDCRDRGRVIAAQRNKLLLQMADKNAINRNGGGRNGTGPADATNHTDYVPTKATHDAQDAAGRASIRPAFLLLGLMARAAKWRPRLRHRNSESVWAALG